MAHPRPTLRGKEWIPLCTQQLRLRNLLQILAVNLQLDNVISCDSERTGSEPKIFLYYTLHATTMSSPFYTSEKTDEKNPAWKEMETEGFGDGVRTSSPGIVVRLWSSVENQSDKVIALWGVYFSGLTYIGPSYPSNPCLFEPNTILLRMHVGYFTASDCLTELVEKALVLQSSIPQNEVQKSYSVNLLLRLHTIQRAIQQQKQTSQRLRDEIVARSFTSNENVPLSRGQKQVVSPAKDSQRNRILKLKTEIENVRFQVKLLQKEREMKQKKLHQLQSELESARENSSQKCAELDTNFEQLHTNFEKLEDKQANIRDAREILLQSKTQLTIRQKELISELNFIYPIAQLPNGMYTIHDIHLPDSEDFPGHDDEMLAVGLGYVTHTLKMISYFLQVPLRYPVRFFGSRSTIFDQVRLLSEKEREFPLFFRVREKYQFGYGVYLLNKDVAQLRHYCNLPTKDLRCTLLNLAGLLQVYPGMSTNITDMSLQHRSLPPSLSRSPLRREGSAEMNNFHRHSKSVDMKNLQFFDDTQKLPRHELKEGDLTMSSHSYSLDHGLNEYEQLNANEQCDREFAGSDPSIDRSEVDDQHWPVQVLEIVTEASKDELAKAVGEIVVNSDSVDILSVQKENIGSSTEGGQLGKCEEIQENTICDEVHSVEDVRSHDLRNSENEFVQQKSESNSTLCDNSTFPENGHRKTSDCVTEDPVWASVTSRTEALAQQTLTFNRMRSRHTAENC